MAFVAGEAQTPERLGDTTGPASRASWWMYRWPVGEAVVVVLWLSQWNSDGPRARSRVRVEGEKRASLLLRVMNSRSVRLGSCQSTPSRWIQGVVVQDPETARLLRSSDTALNSHRGWQESCGPVVP